MNTTGQVAKYCLVSTGGTLRITLVWADPPPLPAAALQLVNDLDLTVRADSLSRSTLPGNGAPDRLNNVEQARARALLIRLPAAPGLLAPARMHFSRLEAVVPHLCVDCLIAAASGLQGYRQDHVLLSTNPSGRSLVSTCMADGWRNERHRWSSPAWGPGWWWSRCWATTSPRGPKATRSWRWATSMAALRAPTTLRGTG